MGCKSCSSGSCGSKNKKEGEVVSGCANNGACGTGGCNKMNVFDWLSDMDTPTFQKFNIVEVKFKGGRKEYYRNVSFIELHAGDPVIVDVPNGHHLGFVSLQGELVRLQMLRKSIKDNEEIKTIYRKANEKDLEKNDQAIARDLPTMYRTREIIKELKLPMKLSDVEFQSDNTKAIFYYSSDDRVDFRELIKTLASEFKIRVEMKQISLRQEAARVGGIGVCGRELCCSTWLTDFKNVTTSAARYQNLSLNPVKLSGQCGRLKCCLNYELETYMDALKDIPTIDKNLRTSKGEAILQKTDIFKKVMWFGYRGEESTWFSVSTDVVKEIQKLNEKGVFPTSFEELAAPKPESEREVRTASGINADLDKMDKKYGGGLKKKGKPDGSNPNRSFNRDNSRGGEPQRNTPQNKDPRPDFKQERKDIKPFENKPEVTDNQVVRPQQERPPQKNFQKQQGQQGQGKPNPNQNRPQGQANPNQNQPQGGQPKPNPNQNRPQGGQGKPNPNQNRPQGEQNKPNPNQPPQGGQNKLNPNQNRPQGEQPKPNPNQQKPQNNQQGGGKPQQQNRNQRPPQSKPDNDKPAE
jgi:cell fate regulator YaaT (PSP1 superfamily)